jgi:hypothetical protein
MYALFQLSAFCMIFSCCGRWLLLFVVHRHKKLQRHFSYGHGRLDAAAAGNSACLFALSCCSRKRSLSSSVM